MFIWRTVRFCLLCCLNVYRTACFSRLKIGQVLEMNRSFQCTVVFGMPSYKYKPNLKLCLQSLLTFVKHQTLKIFSYFYTDKNESIEDDFCSILLWRILVNIVHKKVSRIYTFFLVFSFQTFSNFFSPTLTGTNY